MDVDKLRRQEILLFNDKKTKLSLPPTYHLLVPLLSLSSLSNVVETLILLVLFSFIIYMAKIQPTSLCGRKAPLRRIKGIFALCVAHHRINIFTTFMRGKSPHKRLWIRLCGRAAMRRHIPYHFIFADNNILLHDSLMPYNLLLMVLPHFSNGISLS